MNTLPTFDIKTDSVTDEQWDTLLAQFSDASIYQSSAYGKVRWGENQLSRIVLERDGKAAAIAQLRIIKIPMLKAGIAYLRWGPIWQRKDQEKDPAILKEILKSLQIEYAQKRGLLLRILPNLPDVFSEDLHDVYHGLGFRRQGDIYRTVLLDLSPDLETLRANLTRRWRRQLNKSEKNELVIETPKDEEGFGAFNTLFDEMVARKNFDPGMDPRDYEKMQPLLPEQLRLKFLLCKKDGITVAAIFCGLAGDTAIYLMGATGDQGTDLRGSYTLHWQMIQWLKEQGIRYYDLNGYNPDKNPGTATFKEGFAGIDTRFLGPYDYSASLLSKTAVTIMEKIRG